jgi:hypothetical protein
MSRASVDLPQPDSPTTPSVSSGSMLRHEGHVLICAPIYSSLPMIDGGAVAFNLCATLYVMSRAGGTAVEFKNVAATCG